MTYQKIRHLIIIIDETKPDYVGDDTMIKSEEEISRWINSLEMENLLIPGD